MKNQRGVTLIVLAVTIIVILILVGATVNTLIDEDGMTDQATDLSDRMEEKQQKNDRKVKELIDQLDVILKEANTKEVKIEQLGIKKWKNGYATIELMVIANQKVTDEYKIEYKRGVSSGVWTTYTGPITDLPHNSTLVYRAVKDKAVVENTTTTVRIIDNIVPEEALTTFDVDIANNKVNSVTVTHIDNETGIDISKCKWILNNSNTALGLDSSNYTNAFTSDNQTISLNLESSKPWYIHILSVDKAGNAKETIKGPIEVQYITRIMQDSKGNNIVIPGGFKLASDSGSTVEQGIVVEDADGNQFVWVPVSNTDGSNSNPIIKDDGSKAVITLGRYTFNSSGEETMVQSGDNYESETPIGQYKELKEYRESNGEDDFVEINTSAENLKEFINNVKVNKGFYIARYEASYNEGYNEQGENDSERYKNAKPMSKKSTAMSMSQMNYNKGTLWNCINQSNAAKVCKNMYKSNETVACDLINSYAWDTAIVYMKKMKGNSYAIKSDGNGTIRNTGETGDEVCKIFDMSGNLFEWTTEFFADEEEYTPCVTRGGIFYDSSLTINSRMNWEVRFNDIIYGFRPILYVK